MTHNKNMLKQFLQCGIVGWCLEIIFTAIEAFKKKDFTLKGNTSLWMFPIYGMTALFYPVMKLLNKKPLVLRGSVYTLCIFIVEFITGNLLKKRNLCPWCYDDAKYNIKGLIRLDYAPYWFGTGLLYEFMLNYKFKKN